MVNCRTHEGWLACDRSYQRNSHGEVVVHTRGPKKGHPVIKQVKAQRVLHDF